MCNNIVFSCIQVVIFVVGVKSKPIERKQVDTANSPVQQMGSAAREHYFIAKPFSNYNADEIDRKDIPKFDNSGPGNASRTDKGSGRKKREDKEEDKFRQISLPYNDQPANNVFRKRQLFLLPAEQQMLRQQQMAAVAAAAASLIGPQQMLLGNRFSNLNLNRLFNDYDDYDSSSEESDEYFSDFRRLGLRNPMAEAMRRGVLPVALPPGGPSLSGIGRRSLPDQQIEKPVLR